MKTVNNDDFKAVDFMRKVRSEMSELYQKDKEQFHRQLAEAMKDFLARRKKSVEGADQVQTVAKT